jgi:hypothetical protein
VNFAEQATGRIYLRLTSGSPVGVDRETFERAAADPDTRAGLMAICPAAFRDDLRVRDEAGFAGELISTEGVHTIGRWGSNAPPA